MTGPYGHFNVHALEKIPYAIGRYGREDDGIDRGGTQNPVRARCRARSAGEIVARSQ